MQGGARTAFWPALGDCVHGDAVTLHREICQRTLMIKGERRVTSSQYILYTKLYCRYLVYVPAYHDGHSWCVRDN